MPSIFSTLKKTKQITEETRKIKLLMALVLETREKIKLKKKRN